MTQVLRGNIVQAPQLGKLDIREDGVVQGVYDALPQALASAPITDYGDRLIMQSFVDMHLHAPQYPMLGMGMDLPLLDWLNTYTFRTEARFADPDFARRTYRRLATDLITNGTTRVCMFSSLHTEATWILMEELERAGVTGYVGKVNMDRNALPGILQETTEESVSETLRWLDGCHFEHVKPIITPRFTPSCSNKLMAALGEIARDRGLYVQSHLSENRGEIAWVKELHPDCAQYWETYDKYGLWKDHTVMAHCVHSDARDPPGRGGGGPLRRVQHQPVQRRLPGAGDAAAGHLGDPGVRHRRRGTAPHVQGHHHEHPGLQDQAHGNRLVRGLPDRAGGVLSGHHRRAPVFRRGRGLRRGPAPPRHRGGRRGLPGAGAAPDGPGAL